MLVCLTVIVIEAFVTCCCGWGDGCKGEVAAGVVEQQSPHIPAVANMTTEYICLALRINEATTWNKQLKGQAMRLHVRVRQHGAMPAFQESPTSLLKFVFSTASQLYKETCLS